MQHIFIRNVNKPVRSSLPFTLMLSTYHVEDELWAAVRCVCVSVCVCACVCGGIGRGEGRGVPCNNDKFYVLNKKVQLDATVCRHLFTAESLYMFRASQHPSSGVLKTVSATSVITRSHQPRSGHGGRK